MHHVYSHGALGSYQVDMCTHGMLCVFYMYAAAWVFVGLIDPNGTAELQTDLATPPTWS